MNTGHHFTITSRCSGPPAPAADALTRSRNGGKEAIGDRPRNDVPSVSP
jgi:hypothetical protein